jgi:hypothetical protein
MNERTLGAARRALAAIMALLLIINKRSSLIEKG